jgi:hypothetical protein
MLKSVHPERTLAESKDAEFGLHIFCDVLHLMMGWIKEGGGGYENTM